MAGQTHRPDSWKHLKRFTPARIALGRAGDGLPTGPLLEFQAAHAAARDAVWAALDAEKLALVLKGELPGHPLVRVRSCAKDRGTYLKRPDLGRLLAPEDRLTLGEAGGKAGGEAGGEAKNDILFVLADGLSAKAVEAFALETLKAAFTALKGLPLGPIVLAEQARVGLSDEIGAAMGAKLVVMLIGERPGLSAADSLGAYLTYAPRSGLQNANRNCLSNIREEGLNPTLAGAKIGWLVREALRIGQTGIALKDRSAEALGNRQEDLLGG
ncbi:MAG: ethanolamine ammonia-lyase subunit EutC [Magnetovibrionaceae bacterium]